MLLAEQDAGGNTPLHHAVYRGDLQMVVLMLEVCSLPLRYAFLLVMQRVATPRPGVDPGGPEVVGLVLKL